jgi:hypothetical protein
MGYSRRDVFELLDFSVEHSQREAIAAFPMFESLRIALLYERTTPDLRRSMVFWRKFRAYRWELTHCPVYFGPWATIRDTPAWWDLAVRCLEEGESD